MRATDEARRATDEARRANEQHDLSVASAELSVNVDVMVRLQEVLFAIADDPASHAAIWGDTDTENLRPTVAAQSLLDVLSIALAAVDRLPGFSRSDPGFAKDRNDWVQYTKQVLADSDVVLELVLAHCDYWPEVVEYANEAAAAHDPALESCS